MRNQPTTLLCLLAALLLGRCGPNAASPPDLPDVPDSGEDGSKSPPYQGDMPQGVTGIARPSSSGGASTTIPGPISLAEALSLINRQIDDRSLPVRHLTPDDVIAWFGDGKYFQWSKAERNALEQAFSVGQILDGWVLKLEQIHENFPWRISLRGPENDGWQSEASIVEGSDLELYTQYFRSVCQSDPSHDLCGESFAGTMPSLGSVGLASSIEIRAQPISVAGEPKVPEMAERGALDVSVHLTTASIPAIVDYFAVGYDRTALQDRLLTLLGTESSKWVSIQEFFFGWVRDRVNTFPGIDENDVCHGPARQFYNETLYNGGEDRSTEASALLLHDHYCLVGDDVAPRFGDYLYNPGTHSARFLLTDPATQRDIVFSVQSGGFSAYRLWWADEDMSGKPFSHEPMTDYRKELVDTWRRCR